MQRQETTTANRRPPPTANSHEKDAIVATFVAAYESAEPAALVVLLTEEDFTSMPPMPCTGQAGIWSATRRARGGRLLCVNREDLLGRTSSGIDQ